MSDVPIVDLSSVPVKDSEPVSAPAEVVDVYEPSQLYSEEPRDRVMDDLRDNIEESIKRAGQPVDSMLSFLTFLEVEMVKVREGHSVLSSWKRVELEFAKVQRSVGEARGYRAALASSVESVVREYAGRRS